MYLTSDTFVGGVTSQNMMSVDGEELPGKALEKVMLESFPESRENETL